MVGPGTGLAPFLSYLHEAEHLNDKMSRHKNILFFGNRYVEKDFIHEKYLQGLHSSQK
jgi:sulfite reductase (NADPH) flavoprotein alpha-component